MNVLRIFVIGVLALALPVLLTATTYFISAQSLDTSVASVPASSSRIGVPRPTPTDRDISGNCDEPEHFNDPECRDGVPDDTSGPGSGDDDRSDDSDDNSGPGGSDDDDSGRDHPEDD